jgi:hypothetical protein
LSGSAYSAVKAWRITHKENRAEEARRYRAKHPDKVKAIKDKYRQRTREERLPREAEQARKRRAKDPEGQRRRNQAYLARQLAQKEQLAGRPRAERCELCGEPDKTVFDHCHKLGHFRGWICDRCNKVLGLVYDSTELLGKMIAYLEANSGETERQGAEGVAE